MDAVEIVLAMFLAVIASGLVVRVLPIPLPLPLVQIALGALTAGVFEQGVQLEPHLFFLLFLPPLLFLDGWRIPKEGLLRDKFTILELAFGLVVFTVVGLGWVIHWMIPAMPLAVAFALAAIVSPTDPVAVSAITSRVPIPRRMMHVLEGESLLNDASGLVAFRFAVSAAVTGSFSIASATLSFLWVAAAGMAVGALFTWLVTKAKTVFSLRFGEEPGSQILLSLLIPFGAYQIAEHLHASGILAAVAAGITMSYAELSGRALAITRLQRAAVWNMVQFTLNGLMFVLLGEQLPGILQRASASVVETGHASAWWLLWYALALNFALAALRLLWTLVSLRLRSLWRRRRGEQAVRPPWPLVLAMSLSGVRGAITLAGVLTLPLLLPDGRAVPFRDLAIFLAMSVIVMSLLVASFGLPRLLVGLRIPPDPRAHRLEEMARRRAAKAALAAIERERQQHPGELDAGVEAAAATRVIALYQGRLDGGDTDIDAERLRAADQAERRLRLAALRAERAELFALAREGRLADDVARRLVREIDYVESRYQ
ncbi:MAG: Na+/H+ antiporter [Dokdonella sp.]|nr:Na+/H+ antiporter [Dokdonella sp.]